MLNYQKMIEKVKNNFIKNVVQSCNIDLLNKDRQFFSTVILKKKNN